LDPGRARLGTYFSKGAPEPISVSSKSARGSCPLGESRRYGCRSGKPTERLSAAFGFGAGTTTFAAATDVQHRRLSGFHMPQNGFLIRRSSLGGGAGEPACGAQSGVVMDERLRTPYPKNHALTAIGHRGVFDGRRAKSLMCLRPPFRHAAEPAARLPRERDLPRLWKCIWRSAARSFLRKYCAA